MKIKLSILISVVVTFLILLGVYYLIPIGFLEPNNNTFGSTITTINGSDTLSSSRSVINTNFANLNTGKVEISTTSLPLITTLTGLTSVGTITSGTWNATAISVLKGGTGTTSPSSNYVILGNGTSGFKTVDGMGSNGWSLVSNGAGSAPSWQSVGIDQGVDYIWTGDHTFASTTVGDLLTLKGSLRLDNQGGARFYEAVANGENYATLQASSSMAANLVWTLPNTDGTSSQALITNGGGNLTWGNAVRVYTVGSTTLLSATTEQTNPGGDTYMKLKEFVLIGQGQIDVEYQLKTSNGTYAACGKVYKNGVAFGAERCTNSTNYVTFNEYTWIVPEDLVQIYVKATASSNALIQNAYIEVSKREFSAVTQD